HTCDYYRFCIKAGSIDPTKSENFESSGSPEPRMVARIMGQPLIEWADEYYLLKAEVESFDPRFDEVEPVLVFRSTGFTGMLASLSCELATYWPAEIENAGMGQRLWQLGEGVIGATPCAD